MKSSCTDPQAGRLLHSYELGVLQEPDRSTFERHLLNCDACFQSLEDWEQNISLIREDPEFAQTAASTIREGQSIPRRSLWYRLWPRDRSIHLRPGMAYLVAIGALVLLLITTLSDSRTGVESAQVVYLTALRDVQTNEYVIKRGEPLVVSFHVGKQWANQAIDITLTFDGSLVLADSKTLLLDDLGTGTLFMPSTVLKAGSYRLLLATSGQDPDRVRDTLDYVFRVSFPQ